MYLLGDGAVDIGYDNLIVPVPQVDMGGAPRCALVLRRHREGNLINAVAQVQLFLEDKIVTIKFQLNITLIAPRFLFSDTHALVLRRHGERYLINTVAQVQLFLEGQNSHNQISVQY